MVSLDTVNMTVGIAGLHELGVRGHGARIGVVDAQLCDPQNLAYVEESVIIRPRRRRRDGERTHGDDMLDLLRGIAPEARVVLAEVAEGDGLIFRPSVADGFKALEGRGLTAVLASLEIRRTPERCSTEQPCAACTAARDLARSTVVVIAAGNRGEAGYTCPAAEAGDAIVVTASVGPRDGDASPGEGQSGTSVSAAITVGGVALLRGAFPGLDTGLLRAALNATATTIGGGARRLHFFRAFRCIEHVLASGTADERRAQAVVDDNLALLTSPATRVGAEALEVLNRALRYAPWSAELRARQAIALSVSAPDKGLWNIAEALRLDWELPWLHRELARQLDALGLFGGAVEREVAAHLDAGETGRALRTLRRSLSLEPTPDP